LAGLDPAPRHELVDAALRPSLDEAGEEVGEMPLRIDAVELGRLDQRGDGGVFEAINHPLRIIAFPHHAMGHNQKAPTLLAR
jgi:hypothetical protein